MLDLLTTQSKLDRLLSFPVEGIHIEKYGAGNQAWDARVASCVGKACSALPDGGRNRHAWYAVHVRWFVAPTSYRQDLDNLRLKPILDQLTAAGFWPDDNVQVVRAIYSEAASVPSEKEERVEVTVYGAM